MRALTHALTQPATARAALDALAGSAAPEAVEALVEWLAAPNDSALAPAAVAALASVAGPLADQALLEALDSPLATVRLPAAAALAARKLPRAVEPLERLLAEDNSWPVRRAALNALAALGSWAILRGADDPHWRVRHALVNALLDWGHDAARQEEIDRRLGEVSAPAQPRVNGVREYLKARWQGAAVSPAPAESPPWPFHDPDPAVLVRRLEEMGEDGRCRHLDAMPALLSHESTRARSLARQALARRGTAKHLAAAVARLGDLREDAGETVRQLLAALDHDRVEETARLILHKSDATAAQLAWALDQVGPVFPIEEEEAACLALVGAYGKQPALVRRALVRLVGRWPEKEHLTGELVIALLHKEFAIGAGMDEGELVVALLGMKFAIGAGMDEGVLVDAFAALEDRADLAFDDCIRPYLGHPSPRVRVAAIRAVPHPTGLDGLAGDEDARVRVALAERLTAARLPLPDALHQGPHPRVRAAALSPERAAQLLAEPHSETSWHVLHTAAGMMRIPAWRLEPAPAWQAPRHEQAAAPSWNVEPGPPPHARLLGPGRLCVAPVGLSGHYGLPVEGFARAVERGLDFLFWEPNYQTLTAFVTQVPPSARRRLHVLAGTFEATPQRLRNDVERALRALHIEQLALFLVFWVRGWSRVTDEMRRMLEWLQREGELGMYGLSTHNRALAVEAIEAGWNPVMVRHNAAHRGAEKEVFPHVAAHGTSLITFNSTCYGRLLTSRGGRPVLTAADCYRYSLSQLGVTMCLSAPASLEQLEETLQVAEGPALPAERLAVVLEHGAEVYREETRFRQTIRGR
jgi:HEAT repeat protein